MDLLGHYTPEDQDDTMMIIDRVLPRLQHINPAVVFAAIKLIVIQLHHLANLTQQHSIYTKTVLNKVKKPLITLVQWKQPEIQFTILRNVVVLLQKQPTLLDDDFKAFFVKYNDPNYIKLEKLDILTRLCSASNYEVVLNELKEYSCEIDI